MNAAQLVTLVAEVTIALLSIVGNTLVLYVLWRHQSLWTVTNKFIASLALADLMVGIVGIPCVLVGNQGLPRSFYGCLFISCVIVILTQISIFSLMGIAVERYLAVSHAVFHRQVFDGAVAWLVILASWILGAVVGLVPVFGWHLGEPAVLADTNFTCAFMKVVGMPYMVYFNFFGFVLTPLILIFILYAYIFKVIRARSSKFSKGSQETPHAASLRRSLNKESKAAKRIFLILFAFAVCWLPLHIINTVNQFHNIISIPALTVGILLSHANSALNPVLYFYTNSKLTTALRSTLGYKEKLCHTGKTESSSHLMLQQNGKTWQMISLSPLPERHEISSAER